MSVLCTVFYVLLVMAHTQGAAIALLFAFAISMSGLNPTAVASAGRMTSVTSMGIMLPVASSGAILMPWVIGKVAESAGLCCWYGNQHRALRGADRLLQFWCPECVRSKISPSLLCNAAAPGQKRQAAGG